jgi:hypothetical protein
MSYKTAYKNLQNEYLHAEQLVGSMVHDLKNKYLEESVSIDEQGLRTMHHDIERVKIRLEDMGGGGGGDVMQEFDENGNARSVLGKRNY